MAGMGSNILFEFAAGNDDKEPSSGIIDMYARMVVTAPSTRLGFANSEGRGLSMAHNCQKYGVMVELTEAAPSVLFVVLWRLTDNLELAGWTGTALALCVVLAQSHQKIHPHPIVLGINTHLIIITPLIVGLYQLNFHGMASLIESNSFWGVLVTIFVVGCALTLWSSRGFLGFDGPKTDASQRGSLILLCGSAAAIFWAASQGSQGFVAVGLPITGLFLLRRFLLSKTPVPSALD